MSREFKLDVKDRKLLYELDRNARITLTALAKQAGVSKEVARYRLRMLEKAGLINTYFAIIDVALLGYTIRKAFIKLHNASESQEHELISWLVENKNVVWVASCDGQFDIAFGMRAKNLEKYTEQLMELDNKFGHLFLQREIAPIVRGQYFYRDYLIGKEAGTEREFAFGSVPRKVGLDGHDWRILVELGRDARISLAAMASKIALSPDAVGKRLRRLERAGIIQNYILVLNNNAIGQLHYKVLVRLRSVSQERYRSLLEFCRLHPNIFYIVRTFGVWEFEIDLEVSDVETFRKAMRELKGEFSDIISDYSYITIYRIHKYNFCPSMEAE
ncbi:MAG: Lrp/AsnC family transcriptional regulator [Candidatus ainarchaeum sp.]|nr:Lrp/AsnC family transcriptional regulator [Candidatus ainarchaeum sp.]